MNEMSPTLSALARSGENRRFIASEPKLYKADAVAGFKALILDLLDKTSVLNWVTVSPQAWPTGHAHPFIYVPDPASRPVLFTFVARNGREVENLSANPRVSFALFIGFSFERRRESRGLQAQALAEIDSDTGTWQEAIRILQAKAGPASAAGLHPETHALIRIDTLTAVYFSLESHPTTGTVDYFADTSAVT